MINNKNIFEWISNDDCLKKAGFRLLSNSIDILGNYTMNNEINLPYKIRIVSGNFSVRNCKFNSFHNFPEYIHGYLYMSNLSNIKTLDGLPKGVKDVIHIYNFNNLQNADALLQCNYKTLRTDNELCRQIHQIIWKLQQ